MKTKSDMKKIMFNDKYGLTDAVLNGTKTQTRRIIKPQPIYDEKVGMVWKGAMSGRGLSDFEEPQASYRNFVHNSKYKVGEIVAVAQSYDQVIKSSDEKKQEEVFDYMHRCGFAGLNNKMFVKAELMPHQIKITNVRVQRLQDITEEECIKEGISDKDWEAVADYVRIPIYRVPEEIFGEEFCSPKYAFAELIDKISGKGTWDNNPYVFVYEFDLVQ